MTLEPIQKATLSNSGTLRRIQVHDEFIYSLTDKGLTGEIRKFSLNLKPIWGQTTPYSVNDMSISNEGIVITGHQYAKGFDGMSISSPMIAKMDLNGVVEWQRGPRPPTTFVDDWSGDRPVAHPNTSANLWKLTMLPGGGAICMGLMDANDSKILFHHRFDRHGRTIWSNGCALVKTDWMYTYPGKVEPMFSRHKEYLYHFGAYRIKQSKSQIAGFKIHIRSGAVVKRYQSDRPFHQFTNGALSKNGDCAIGTLGPKNSPSTILALDSEFNKKSELTTSLQPWADIIWNGPEDVIVAGGIQKGESANRTPGIERFLIRDSPVSRPQLLGTSTLSGFARLSTHHHAFISLDEDKKNRLTIRRLDDGSSWSMCSDSMTNLQLESIDNEKVIVGMNNMGASMTLITF